MAFLYFDNQIDPGWVAYYLGIRPETAKRYYRDWKKLPLAFNQAYILLRETMGRMSSRDKTLLYQELADELGCEIAEIEQRMARPWALRDLATQRWKKWGVEVVKRKGLGHAINTLVDKFKQHSEDVEYVLAIARGEPSIKKE